MRPLCWLGSWLTWIGSHREGSRWDVGQLESDTGRHASGWWHRSATGKADCGNQEQNVGQLRGLTHWTDESKRRKRTTGGAVEAAYSMVVGPGKVSNCDETPGKRGLSEVSPERYRIE